MPRKNVTVFAPDVPPDREHAPLIREEALDWLERQFPGQHSFTTGQVLSLGGDPNRRWLISRLRARDIGNESEFSLPDTADALTVLFLRSKGVKFLDAVDAVIGGKESSRLPEPRYGGVWNRLIVAALEGLRRRIPARLLAGAVFSFLRDPKDHFNCLVIIKLCGKQVSLSKSLEPRVVEHDYVYRVILERPAPACSVIAPSGELMFFAKDQLPARSEVTSRRFITLRLATELETYQIMLGTMKSATVQSDPETLRLAGRILDIAFVHLEEFVKNQASSRLETPVEPEQASANDLQLWLITRFLASIYANSLCEISDTSSSTGLTRILASSMAKPWEPSPLEPARSLDMLSGYAARTGVPLVVERAEPPWTMVIQGIEAELRYIKSQTANSEAMTFLSMALPIIMSSGQSRGSLYMLMPRLAADRLANEVRVFTVFSRIVGETIERHQSALLSARTTANAVSQSVLRQDQFQAALLNLLVRMSQELRENRYSGRDVRLPFLLVSAHNPEPDQFDPPYLSTLKNWLVGTLKHMEWRSFMQSHWSGASQDSNSDGFVGEVPGVGIMIALGKLVSKDELDQIRNAFPSTMNRTSPTNSPVKLVAWVLDVPSPQIMDATRGKKLQGLASEIENWAFAVAGLVDELAQSATLRDQGEWDASLKKIRQALQKPAARNNSYLRRLAADCSLALADWPGALKYAREAVAVSGLELGAGLVRSLCIEADAHLCLCKPSRSLELYSEAASKSINHPLPSYCRGQALLLMARLLKVYQDEQLKAGGMDAAQEGRIENVLQELVNSAMEDLTSAADLLDRWGLIPESYQYRNFHLVPTLLGQGLGYELTGSPGPAASRLQSARRSFPRDDLFFREFLFAKLWEQGVHRQYADLLLGDAWKQLHKQIIQLT